MAKMRPDEIRQADIDEYVSTQSDFAFEASVARLVANEGLTVEHGGTYDDPVTRKPRQFDIRARYQREIDGITFLAFMAIETKNLQLNNPLVIHTVPRKPAESFHSLIGSWSDPRDNALSRPPQHAVANKVSPSGLFHVGDPCGKSTDQIHRLERGELNSNDHDIYEKWAQAISSSHDLVELAAQAARVTGRPRCISVVMPLVVIPDSTLWRVNYDEAGTRFPAERVHDCSFLLDTSIFTGPHPWDIEAQVSHIEFLTVSALQIRLHSLVSSNWSHYWDFVFWPEAVNAIRRQLDKRPRN